MSKIKLDLREFKHVKSDDKSTTLQHKNGHSLTLAHKSLSPEAQAQLQALAKHCSGGPVQKMADGGEVDQPINALMAPSQPEQVRSEDPNAIVAQQQVDAVKKDPSTAIDANLQATKDAYNSKLAASGVVMSQDDMFGPNGEPPKNPVNPTLWGAAENTDAATKLADQQIADRQQRTAQSNSAQQQMSLHDKAVAQNQVNQKLGLPLVPDPGAPQAPVKQPDGSQMAMGSQPQNSVQPMAQPQNPQAQPQNPNGNAEGMMMRGYGNQMSGIQNAAKAQVALAQEQQKAYQHQQETQAQALQTYQQHYQDLEAERQNAIQDIKDGHIDPNQYWTGVKDPATGQMVGGHSKILSAIGMILGGFGSLPGAGGNVAAGLIQRQMEQNLDAQKANLGSKQNLLAANLRQFGNLKDATDMTRIMQSDLVTNELNQAAAKAASPMAKAAALKAAGELQEKMAPVFQQFAMRRAMMGLANNGGDPQSVGQMLQYMRVMNPEMAKEMEGRYVPGIGLAQIPLTPDVRGKLEGYAGLERNAQDLMDFSKSHSTIIPGTPEYNIGAQKAMALQSAIRDGLLRTVFKESEVPLLSKFVNENPAGAFKSISTIPKLQELIASSIRDGNVLKKQYGLPVRQEAGPITVDKRTGFQYTRGPNGQAIRVK